MKIKIFVRMLILAVFAFYFGKSLIFGQMGIIKFFERNEEIKIEKHKIARLEGKIKKVEKELARWKADDFELERMAREELAMGDKNEKVFILP